MRILATTFLLLAPALAGGEDPVLLAKHPACFVHALPAFPANRLPVERVLAPGHVLLYTSRETGKMTRLVEATGTVAVNTRRISYVVTRLIGVVADSERLYVLLGRSGRIFDRPPGEGAPIAGGRYELRVFRLADGSALPAAGPGPGPADLPEFAPPASLDAGPLRVVAGGVAWFGTTTRYDDHEARGR